MTLILRALPNMKHFVRTFSIVCLRRNAWFTLDAVNGKRNPRAEFPRVNRGFSALEFTLDSTEELPTDTEEVSTEGGSLVTVVDALCLSSRV